MVNLSELRSLQGEARTLADDLGVVTRDLKDKELTRFGRSFERQFIINLPERAMVDLHRRHKAEALLGAMIAKEQMDSEIDDEQPASNKVGGPLAIDAQWLGIGDDWEDLNSIYAGAQNAWTTGAPQDWIHSGTTFMGGTAANTPIRIGGNAVHVVYGIGSVHASPKIHSVQFTIDGKQKPKILLFWAQRINPGAVRPIKELDNAYIFKKNTTVLADVFISDSFGAPDAFVTDYPRLYGVSYIKEPALRLLDPVTPAAYVLGTTATLVGVRFDVLYQQ